VKDPSGPVGSRRPANLMANRRDRQSRKSDVLCEFDHIVPQAPVTSGPLVAREKITIWWFCPPGMWIVRRLILPDASLRSGSAVPAAGRTDKL
jgi:hypothetical protein